MRKLDQNDEYIVQRLCEWAEWYTKGCDSGIGYSSKSLIARIRDGGGMLIKGTGAKFLPSNCQAEEIEDLVKELYKQQPARAIVLRIHYFFDDGDEFKAKRSGFKKTQYHLHLRLAHEWIKGFLCAQIKFS